MFQPKKRKKRINLSDVGTSDGMSGLDQNATSFESIGCSFYARSRAYYEAR